MVRLFLAIFRRVQVINYFETFLRVRPHADHERRAAATTAGAVVTTATIPAAHIVAVAAQPSTIAALALPSHGRHHDRPPQLLMHTINCN